MWHDDNWIDTHVKKTVDFDYFSHIDQLQLFKGTHPSVMLNRINSKNWKFEYDISYNRIKFKDRFKNFLRNYLNIDIRYKNYIKI